MRQVDAVRCAARESVDIDKHRDVQGSTLRTSSGSSFVTTTRDSSGGREWTWGSHEIRDYGNRDRY